MRQSRLAERELRLEAERCIKYRGTARISLEVLHFQSNQPRELSQKNVERLKEIFRIEKIHRLNPRNHIPAVIHQSDLEDAIQASDTTAERLLSNPANEPPLLAFPAGHRLTCLHGRHRVQAARETLPPTDAWWTVDLYLADSNPALETTLVEEYSNEKKPSDGEIYCKIRQYEQERNLCFKNRWKARLSDHGRRALRQLQDHEELTAAFDDLLGIPGLWDGMRISTLHKMTGMNCDDVILHRLELIKEVWSKLVGRNKMALQRVDQATIFSAFSEQEREAIWNELLSIDCLIPSLYTFFEDLKYLSACADCLKRLVRVSRKETVNSALERKFTDVNQIDNQCIFEVAESTFAVRSGRSVDRLEWGKRQLWLFAMRHYGDMPAQPKKKEKDLLAKAKCYTADEAVLCEFAALADRLGFASREIDDLKKGSSDREIARNALLKARKPDRYKYDDATFEDHVNQIVRMFTSASPLSSERLPYSLVSDIPQASGNRCGFPDKEAHKRDSKLLFITNLCDSNEEQGEDITSFFVRRSVYFSFFGKPTDICADGDSNLTPLPSENVQRNQPSSSLGLEMDGMEYPQRLDQEELRQREIERLARLEQARLEQERLEQERLEQERLEQKRQQERLEQERLEQERLEQARLEQERFEQERLEQERLEQERLEQERLEQERLEQARLEQARIEQERLEREKLEKLEQERLKQERQKHADQARLEQERLARLWSDKKS
ncbi:hypothetical protein CC80DRAFT_556252 [Byssothecium circinans]|uniref:Uncharacterized protein n=1 Tax=Byssothecium circinans TaxID=147558 RepID=A0A6A5TCR1_9PLEO|nr:hypothetical protein CC80DRAFT_556252 [Byssothecium circinans]